MVRDFYCEPGVAISQSDGLSANLISTTAAHIDPREKYQKISLAFPSARLHARARAHAVEGPRLKGFPPMDRGLVEANRWF